MTGTLPEKPPPRREPGTGGGIPNRQKVTTLQTDGKRNFGRHAALEAGAEDCAKVILSTALIHGFQGPLESLTVDDLPTPQLQQLARLIRDTPTTPGQELGDVLTAVLAMDVPQDERDMLHLAVCEISETPFPSNPDLLEPHLAKLLHFIEVREEQFREWGTGQTQAEPAERFFYDGQRYYLDTGAEFVPLDQRSVYRHCRGWEIPCAEIDALLCKVQTLRFITYAGALAGHRRGLHTAGGQRLLATSSPTIIRARPGPWGTLRAVVENLLGDPEAGAVQIETFLGWVKIARESLLSGNRRPGQALALAGPRGCGKSLLIDVLALALGGRRANPYPYFSGRTNFNGDLAGAELLAVDDEAGSSDIRSRKALAANIKSCLFSGAVRIEGKGRTAFSFAPCWRMVLALNDEPEALLVLPPLTEDIGDKLTLLKCRRLPLPMPAHTMEERERFFGTLRRELPGMLAHLEAWEIPDELREERCGVLAYHHPHLLAALNELSPEGQLLAMVDTAHAGGTLPLPWLGSAAELRAILCGTPGTGRDAEKLLGAWTPATGTFLGRLEGAGRVERLTVRDGIQRWRIIFSGAVE
ncbi:MAG: DUF5906 domain-containing protein [Verrucomicrobia bacterium]|nr:DUF5906 domain-containing protein [Verrucomicrobiota bacterium]